MFCRETWHRKFSSYVDVLALSVHGLYNQVPHIQAFLKKKKEEEEKNETFIFENFGTFQPLSEIYY